MGPFPGASVEENEERCKELQTGRSVWRTDNSTASLKKNPCIICFVSVRTQQSVYYIAKCCLHGEVAKS